MKRLKQLYLVLLLAIPVLGKEKGNQIYNSLMWGCIGDTIGSLTEFIPSVDEIRKQPIFDQQFDIDWCERVLQEVQRLSGFSYAPYTDDTRMSLLVCKALIDTVHEDEQKKIIEIARSFWKDSFDFKTGWIASYRAPGMSTTKAIQTDNEQTICLLNAIASAIITGGDSDSLAAVTGALCGSFVQQKMVPKQFVLYLEDHYIMSYYVETISNLAVD